MQVGHAVFGDHVMHIAPAWSPRRHPGVSTGTMRETVPCFAVEGSAMIGLPPLRPRCAADEIYLSAETAVGPGAQESEQTWPVRSTCSAELMATMWSFCAMTNGSLM